MISYQTSMFDGTSAWPILLVPTTVRARTTEPSEAALLQHFNVLEFRDVAEWRRLFALSTRCKAVAVSILQSKNTFSTASAEPQPDHASAQALLYRTMPSYLCEPIQLRGEFMFVYSLTKADPFSLPLHLTRYACMF